MLTHVGSMVEQAMALTRSLATLGPCSEQNTTMRLCFAAASTTAWS